ncbi:glutamyl-tRNA synthetase [Thiobacillus denitrificans ATCC 25259]|uniref:Glutamyl-Q tRNA(Asp) synthetase n=1 Tax=Thiobacillus denitrificans (strain ATCC 25259 / T1) TaxID=292415 RepID=GLUQ_THIDA|nr:tRNA glutamyl-Q(34) synthetase GluQRS [Thiobacillus denitrificans]Q3SFE8.1 RecName: Full=Glutamyl-Q tRNA(Asp) synthetase; Short=Glu-Q-RSs [Thiobacillus denitrificans ATCC 25259]AAZ98662.1 glutamyl-tRNA synthetase [Thiobacillus denitrificans ATCC 25259]
MNPAACVGRFAPSPTGPLHLGSLVAAVASFLDARAAGGRWLVRMEDLDRPRCEPGAAGIILRQLEAYGLVWDGDVLVQSQRDHAYAAALDMLKAQGAAYPCACTRAQLVQAPRNREGEMLYPGTCRNGLPADTVARAWRVRAPDASIRLHDRIHGDLQQNLAREVGDFIVKRADGLFAYQLAVVVDDAFQGITHVVRGADLLWNTPRQIYLQGLLGVPTPTYAHVPLITNVAGQKLSKQTRAPALPERGRDATLAQALVTLGHPPPGELAGAAPAELLTWASTHWHIENVPTHPVVAKPAP